jgi:hypothetical protein
MERWVLDLDSSAALGLHYLSQSCTILALASRTSPPVRLSSKGVQRSEDSSTVEPPVHSTSCRAIYDSLYFGSPYDGLGKADPGFGPGCAPPGVLPTMRLLDELNDSATEVRKATQPPLPEVVMPRPSIQRRVPGSPGALHRPVIAKRFASLTLLTRFRRSLSKPSNRQQVAVVLCPTAELSRL